MEESELTRKAIEELMKEMDENNEKDTMPTERKKNPLGRPNKLFLGRTINSIMNHNKRQADKTQQRCERKLKELDAKKTKHESKKNRKYHQAKSIYCHEIVSSDNSKDGFSSKIRKRKKKRVKKKSHRSRSISSSSSSSSVVTNSSSSSNSSAKSKIRSRKKKRHKNTTEEEEYEQGFHSNYMPYYVDPNIAYAAMAYSQMSNLIQQQQLQQQVKVEEELEEESIEIPSDLNISCHSSSESSLNISLHSSSAEEDENGVLTFKLSSDDDEKVPIPQNVDDKRNKSCSSKDCDDKESLHSHISLESKDSEKSALNETVEIFELSSSDSDELEIVETTLANISN